MAYIETKRTGYGTRLKNSIGGIGFGFLLFLGGTALLWWNEGRAVKTTKMLEEGQEVTLHVDNVDKIDNSLNGKLIHATAMTATDDSLVDATFGVGAKCVKLRREVQHYQWVEKSQTTTKDKVGGAQEEVTEYTYEKKWVRKPEDSQKFHVPSTRARNFTLMNVETEEQVAKNVNFGAYKLPSNLISSISGSEPFNLDIPKEQLERWNNDVLNLYIRRHAQGINDPSYITRQVNNSPIADNQQMKDDADSLARKEAVSDDLDYVHVTGNEIYIGRSSSSPEVGDVKITFTKVLPGQASVIAEVYGDNLQSYTASNGKSLAVLTMGAVSVDKMYQAQHSSNSMWTWILRIVGILMIIFGLKGIVNILETLFKVIPFLASIVGMATGLVCWVFGLSWSMLVIAIAWIFYRPVLGIILLVISGGLIFWLKNRSKNKKDRTPAATEPQV